MEFQSRAIIEVTVGVVEDANQSLILDYVNLGQHNIIHELSNEERKELLALADHEREMEMVSDSFERENKILREKLQVAESRLRMMGQAGGQAA